MMPALLGSANAVAATGAASFTVDLPATIQAASAFSVAPSTASAGWRFKRDATVDRLSSSWSWRHDWGSPSGGTDGDDFQIRITLNSGTAPSGMSMGVWYDLSSARSVSLSRSTFGFVSCNLTVSIRDVATLTVQDTATYTISVTVDSGF